MKLLLLVFALVVSVSSAPQVSDAQDAEFVPQNIPRGTDGSSVGGSFPPGGFNVHVIGIPRSPGSGRTSLIDLLFGSGSSRGGPGSSSDDTPTGSGLPDFFTQFFGGRDSFFPSIGNRPFVPSFPDLPDFPGVVPDFGDLPERNESTHEVKVVNGTRMEVNRTVTRTENDGVVFTQILISYAPEGNGTSVGNAPGSGGDAPQPKEGETDQGTGESVSESDPATNQVEDFEEEPAENSVRNRRWLTEWIRKAFPGAKKKVSTLPLISEGESNDEESSAEAKPAEREGGIISYEGDTDVNYRGVQPKRNPDAEVFDVELLNDAEDLFYGRRPKPMRFQPIRTRERYSQFL